MKSGIPNKLQIITLTDQHNLSVTSELTLKDAPVALACKDNTIHSIIATGMKSFIYAPPKSLTPASSFTHDLLISSIDQSAIAVSKSHLIIASDEGNITILKLPHLQLLHATKPHSQGVTDMVIHPSLPMIATTARDRTTLLINLHTAEPIQSLKPTQPPALRTSIRAVRFTNDDHLFFTAESNPRQGGWVAAWRSATPADGKFAPVSTIRVSSDALTAITVNSTATLAAVSSSEGHVIMIRWNGYSFTRVWTTEPKRTFMRPPPPPHVLPVTGMSFAGDGTYLLTASADYTVAVWPIKAPMDPGKLRRIVIRVLITIVMVFAFMMAEDEMLHSGARKGRSYVEPLMEPSLGKVRGIVRPPFRKGMNLARPLIASLRGDENHERDDESGVHSTDSFDEPNKASPIAVNTTAEIGDVDVPEDIVVETELAVEEVHDGKCSSAETQEEDAGTCMLSSNAEVQDNADVIPPMESMEDGRAKDVQQNEKQDQAHDMELPMSTSAEYAANNTSAEKEHTDQDYRNVKEEGISADLTYGEADTLEQTGDGIRSEVVEEREQVPSSTSKESPIAMLQDPLSETVEDVLSTISMEPPSTKSGDTPLSASKDVMSTLPEDDDSSKDFITEHDDTDLRERNEHKISKEDEQIEINPDPKHVSTAEGSEIDTGGEQQDSNNPTDALDEPNDEIVEIAGEEMVESSEDTDDSSNPVVIGETTGDLSEPRNTDEEAETLSQSIKQAGEPSTQAMTADENTIEDGNSERDSSPLDDSATEITTDINVTNESMNSADTKEHQLDESAMKLEETVENTVQDGDANVKEDDAVVSTAADVDRFRQTCTKRRVRSLFGLGRTRVADRVQKKRTRSNPRNIMEEQNEIETVNFGHQRNFDKNKAGGTSHGIDNKSGMADAEMVGHGRQFQQGDDVDGHVASYGWKVTNGICSHIDRIQYIITRTLK